MASAPLPLASAADRLLVVISDVEMGAGGRFDDFPHSDLLGERIVRYCAPPFRDLPVDLIFNGDTFDLLKTAYLDTYPRHVTRDVALGKMARVAAAHPLFFSALRTFLAHDRAPRRVIFLEGNHDAELRFPEVQGFIRSLCGADDRVLFPGLFYSDGRVHIEHGQQRDPMFRVDPRQPIIDFEGQEILAQSWGAAALLETVIPLQPLLHFHDRLKPKQQVFELMPEIKELLVGLFWQYWTRDYWKDFFGSRDPTRKLTWTMLKEVLWRLTSKEVEVSLDVDARKRLEVEGPHDLYVMGHLHQPALHSFGHRKLILAGCFRNEYMILEEGKRLHPIPKSYVEIQMQGEAPLCSSLLEAEAMPAPEGYVPDSIFDVLPEVRRLLEEAQAAKENKGANEARVAQEKKEAREGSKGDAKK